MRFKPVQEIQSKAPQEKIVLTGRGNFLEHGQIFQLVFFHGALIIGYKMLKDVAFTQAFETISILDFTAYSPGFFNE